MNPSAKNAINRYLKDLNQSLHAAPKVAKEDALTDAEEFLNNEVSAPETKHLATSEQLTYDHCIASYGSPNDIAAEYLQSVDTTSHTLVPKPWKSLAVPALGAVVLVVTVGAILLERFQEASRMEAIFQSDFEGDRIPPKVSPFTQVDFEDEKVFVELNGTTYEWLSIDDIPVSKVIASSKEKYRDLWQKRITEDLVEVLWGMGHYPKKDVKLRLQDLGKNAETIITAAPMTRENRQSMYGNYIVSIDRPRQAR